jgi:hypothetical protein
VRVGENSKATGYIPLPFLVWGTKTGIAGRVAPESLGMVALKGLNLGDSQAGRVMTHDQILQLVWGQEYYGETELVRSMVRRLRSKLGDNAQDPRYIFRVAQVGYRMAAP